MNWRSLILAIALALPVAIASPVGCAATRGAVLGDRADDATALQDASDARASEAEALAAAGDEEGALAARAEADAAGEAAASLIVDGVASSLGWVVGLTDAIPVVNALPMDWRVLAIAYLLFPRSRRHLWVAMKKIVPHKGDSTLDALGALSSVLSMLGLSHSSPRSKAAHEASERV